jgi:hypothetical protein
MSGGPRERRDTDVPAGPQRSMESEASRRVRADWRGRSRCELLGPSWASPFGPACGGSEIVPAISVARRAALCSGFRGIPRPGGGVRSSFLGLPGRSVLQLRIWIQFTRRRIADQGSLNEVERTLIQTVVGRVIRGGSADRRQGPRQVAETCSNPSANPPMD